MKQSSLIEPCIASPKCYFFLAFAKHAFEESNFWFSELALAKLACELSSPKQNPLFLVLKKKISFLLLFGRLCYKDFRNQHFPHFFFFHLFYLSFFSSLLFIYSALFSLNLCSISIFLRAMSSFFTVILYL